MKILSDDGKRFESVEQCELYEKSLEEKRNRAKKLADEKEARYNAVIEAYKKAGKLEEQYEKDYGSAILRDPLDVFFPFISKMTL
ncbi:hypothetical protein GKG47_09225 [Lactonifactor sp. BIOML-A3]|uniref:hypothetical protein n=1 Tax=unclassified Lactonifactor TaxID=2636670 RepID=UPI0012AEE553|nr:MULTISPECIES: hypothetical protein [unclassified Lactonifactor]MSA02219.1 hypothetical protein [Lactonifactor sp. BIOML-A5]MSA08003.1 hypothetical protein [Lactonifactor sp. BIOML-A4]MSA12619.1 hypothetical protein [Lactonifactor sp. BIOML-A3]MSA16679.1 hypothetical protein [Lactonifactor sp. BIOML-A2]MSA37622.1 hypothetical protein [Lactonifactor sp. BIOML-A1]